MISDRACLLISQYRTRAVLELTGVIQTPPTSSSSDLIDKKFAMSSELEEALNEESLEVLASEENSRLKVSIRDGRKS